MLNKKRDGVSTGAVRSAAKSDRSAYAEIITVWIGTQNGLNVFHRFSFLSLRRVAAKRWVAAAFQTRFFMPCFPDP